VLRRFLQNTAISAVAYGLAGVLGLFAVGMIARSYGLAVLGLIVLVRAFLPSGFLGLIDLGLSEITTQAVARGRVSDPMLANERLTLLTFIAGLTGITAAVVLWITAAAMASIFKVALDQTEAFVSIIKVTALVLPLTFLGLVAEGVLKGFEYYGWLRVTEVSSNLVYVAAVYILVWRGVSFEWLAYWYLTTVIAKYLILAFVVYHAARGASMRFAMWTAPIRRDIVHRCWLMFNSRIGGTLQQPFPPLAIGALYGPIEVGSFDLITRLPRFLKATMAPLYAAILPVSTLIDETTDTRRLQILGRSGLILPAALVIPMLVVVALFSEDILKIWVGPQHADQWPWLAISLCIPAVTAMLGAGQTALMVRADFLRVNTRLTYLQVFTQYAVTLVFMPSFREKAFILGWAVSYVVFASPIAHYMLRQMALSISLFWHQVVRLAIVAGILMAVILPYRLISGPASLIGLSISGGLACIVAWMLSFIIVLSSDDRAMFGRFVQAVAARRK
jgi:O-antigen/teichoic acid export membrane protein